MELRAIHKKLEQHCPPDYRINEIITFAYPYRRIRINATVNKSPEKSIQQVYATFLRTIKAGYCKEEQLIRFLGLHQEDFILRELYFLKERGFLDYAAGSWLLTEQGAAFIEDNGILKILEEEEFEFLVDVRTNEVVPKKRQLFHHRDTDNILETMIDFSHKDPSLLDGKNEELGDIYKRQHNGQAYLVDYDPSDIKFDKVEHDDYYLVEYLPCEEKKEESEPYIEVRNINKEGSLEKRLSKILSKNYPNVLYQLTNSDRPHFARIEELDTESVEEFKTEYSEQFEVEKRLQEPVTLSVWETQAKFAEALKAVKSKLLIESPWIKRATLKYISGIEKALKRGVLIVIFYGIESDDEHHYKTIEKLRSLKRKYAELFHLIHLPSHFEEQGNRQMTGTHRKLVIKDNDYYIQGSFNFLSFNKEVGQKIANEESILIRKKVSQKWSAIFSEYQINRDILNRHLKSI